MPFSPWQIAWNMLHNMAFKQLFSRGSIKDQASIDLANHYGIAMILLGLVISNINFKGETDEYISDWAWWS